MNYDPRFLLAQRELLDLGYHPGRPDGLWGERSTQALSAWEEHERALAAPSTHIVPITYGQFDTRTELNISKLTPLTQLAARRFMAAVVPAMAKHGYEVRITSGMRTYAEQNQLYSQGRSTKGPIVTNAKGGWSWHNFGCGFDITLFKDGVPVYESPYYEECAEIGRAQGLDCGLFWKGLRDEPHYNVTGGLTMQQMRERLAAGKAIP